MVDNDFSGVPGRARIIKQIVTVVERGTEEAYKKVLDHLLVDKTRRVPNPTGGFMDETVTVVHPPYLARKYWDATNRKSFADPSDPYAMQLMFGRVPDYAIVQPYTKFLGLYDAGSLGIEKPVREPGADSSAHVMPVIKFWRQCVMHREPEVRIIGREAIRMTSIAISQTPAEQSFAVLSNHQQSNRLSGGSRYVRNLLNLTYNRALLWKMLGAQAVDAKKKLGRK